MASTDKDLAIDLTPLLRWYKDGTVRRLFTTPYVPPSPEPNHTSAVSSKDIAISPNVSVRLYLPRQAITNQIDRKTKKLPVLVYYHSGGFCVESAFSALSHNYIDSIVSESQSFIVVSVEYRLAPEHPLPAAYEDSWVALNWVSSHANQETDYFENKDQWLVDYGDFDRLYIGGDSAGGNITHNMAIRAGMEKLKGGVKILGGFLSHPHFWGSKAIGSEPTENREDSLLTRLWRVVYPAAPGGDDSPMVNPWAEDAPSLAKLGVSRLLVMVSENDFDMRDRGVEYVDRLKRSGWGGEVELVEFKGEEHCFQLFNRDSKNAKNMIKRLASFIK